MIKDNSPEPIAWAKKVMFHSIGLEASRYKTCRDLWLNTEKVWLLKDMTCYLKTANNYAVVREWLLTLWNATLVAPSADEFRNKCVELKCYQWCRNG